MTDTIWRPDLTQYAGPKYLALTRALRDAIRGGTLPEGAQLPTVRDLAWAISVTPGTVQRAYQLATQEGLLAATVGRGTFVAARRPRLGPTQALYTDAVVVGAGLVDLRSPHLPDMGQGAAFCAAMERLAPVIAREWTDYPSQRGEDALRAAVADWVADRPLGPLSADDIALTAGGQNAILLVLLCCLRGDRPVVLIEELAYPGFRHAARLARADVVTVETDDEGIVPEALVAACQRHGPQVLCLTPEAQNPTTARMGTARRAAIIDIARSFDLQVVEDLCYATADPNLPALRQLAPERVWQIGSLSKTLSASLRFGYVICPTGMGEAGRLTTQHAFFALARPVSDLALDLFRSGAARELRVLVDAELDARLELLVAALSGFDLRWRPGLRFAFLHLPNGWRASTFTRQAEADGVLVRSADEYALVSGRAPNAVRIAIAGDRSRQDFADACLRLQRLLRNPPNEWAV